MPIINSLTIILFKLMTLFNKIKISLKIYLERIYLVLVYFNNNFKIDLFLKN